MVCGIEGHQAIEIIALLRNSSGSSINRPGQFLSAALSFIAEEINWIARSPAVF